MFGPPKDGSLEAVIRGALPPEEQRALSRWRWHDRLVSLWAPVTVLALVFTAYLVVVESAVCTYPWLQPPMQALGLGCFAWWAVLVVARTGLGPVARWEKARVARYRAEEVLAEAARLYDANATKLEGGPRYDVNVAAVALVRSYGGDAQAIGAATTALEKATEKGLAKYRKAGVLDFGGGFVKALLVALAFRAVLVEPFKIPSSSMIPTLEIGDQIFVNKFIYGVRLPFTNWVPFVIWRAPRRGDVIVFNNPVNPAVDYIKRVVGVPGDVLEFDENGLRVNGADVPRTLEADPFTYWDQQSSLGEPLLHWVRRWRDDDWSPRQEVLYRETLDGGPHLVLDDPRRRTLTLARMAVHRVVVPDGAVFVMGDNRNNSEDSRVGLGTGAGLPEFVPFGHIKGKATVIWLALGHGGFLSSVFGGTGIRYDRFFLPVSMCGSEAPRSGAP